MINYTESFDFKPIPTITPASDYWQNGTWKFNMPEITPDTAYAPSFIDIILHGNTALTLVNAKANSLEYLKLFGGTELLPETYLDTVTLSGGTRQSNVPEGYTEVDGITNSGNKQINIGNSLNQDDEIELVFSFPTSDITQQQIFGRRASANENNISVFFAGTANRLVVDFNNSDYSAYRLTADVSPNTIYTVLVSKSRRAIYQGDTLIAENTTVCNDTITISVGDVRLYGVGGNPAYNAYFTGTIYSLKIKNKLNMIACKRNSDNAVGFYNNVSSENFYTLQGGTAGADVTVPTPSNPMDIVCNNGVVKYGVIGKNLYNDATKVEGYYISATGVITEGINSSYSALIPVKPNMTYVFSGINSASTSANKRLHAYDSNGVWLEQLNFVNNIVTNTPFTVTGTTTAQTAYVRISFSIADTNVQLEEGSIATAYEPYQAGIYTDGTVEVVTDSLGNTANAEMLLAVGNIKDTQEVLNGSVTRQIGIKVLDGTENWTQAQTANAFYLDDAFDSNVNIEVACYCNYFYGLSGQTPITNMPATGSIKCGFTNALRRLYIRYSGFNSLSDLTSYLASKYNVGTPVVIVYPLATTTTETVTAQPMNIQAGTNVVEIMQASLDNLELEVKYKAGVEVTITEVQNAQLDDNVEVTING